jgi:hypothetical protein
MSTDERYSEFGLFRLKCAPGCGGRTGWNLVVLSPQGGARAQRSGDRTSSGALLVCDPCEVEAVFFAYPRVRCETRGSSLQCLRHKEARGAIAVGALRLALGDGGAKVLALD